MLLHDEILEQPAVLERAIVDNRHIAMEARAILERTDVHHVVIAARGTSDNAARYAKYAWGSRLGLPVTLAAPSLFTRYSTPPNLDGAAVVCISQAGQSPDMLSVIDEAGRQNRPTIAVTNDPTSPVAANSTVVVPLGAAPERSIAATKSYTASLLAIAMIAEDSDALTRVPDAVAGALARERDLKDAANRMAPMSKAVVLGRGHNHATAFEWAIKLQEMAYVLAHPYSTADFAHGPYALLEPGFPVLAVIADGVLADDGLTLLHRARDETGASITVLTNTDVTDLARVDLPAVDEWLSPMMFIAAAQLFTLYTAIANGVDPETPRGLIKVTKTS